jgi:hypothetical protein
LLEPRTGVVTLCNPPVQDGSNERIVVLLSGGQQRETAAWPQVPGGFGELDLGVDPVARWQRRAGRRRRRIRDSARGRRLEARGGPSVVGKARARRRPAASSGGKLGLGDSLIAGVAADLCATVVTRNGPDFELEGIEVGY